MMRRKSNSLELNQKEANQTMKFSQKRLKLSLRSPNRYYSSLARRNLQATLSISLQFSWKK
jgi:hypothetical protein